MLNTHCKFVMKYKTANVSIKWLTIYASWKISPTYISILCIKVIFIKCVSMCEY